MSISYSLPDNLDKEILQLEELFSRYKKGEITVVELKAHRVPFGVYEQREFNTYMVRIRCTAGIIRPEQLEKVSIIAKKFGINLLHITTRQELQIHYVKLDDIVNVIKAVREIGLATRGGGGNTVRNIMAEESAGIDKDEVFDVSPYAISLTTRLISEEDSWTLPRKFKIAFSGSDSDRGYATISDVGFIAKLKDGRKGFKVYVAGGLGAKSEAARAFFEFIDESEVYVVTKAIKRVFWKYGNRKNKHAARLRFLWNTLGEEEFRKKFNEECEALKKEEVKPLIINEIENKACSFSLVKEKASSLEDFNLWKKRFVKAQKQTSSFSILIPIKLGFITCDEAVKLGQFLKSFGDNVIRMTKEQNFLLRNIPEEYLGNLYNFLAQNIKDFNPPPIFGKILSCAGASTCQLGICLSRQAAYAIINILKKSNLDLDRLGDIKINISGCPNSCGQHPIADIGFFGKAQRKEDKLYPAYNVLAGANLYDGKTQLAEVVGEIAARDLPALVKNLINIYLTKKSVNYKDDLKELLTCYKDVPGFSEDRNYYFDWDAEKPFSLSDRRSGECSAGIFDLIEMDLGNIKETRKKITLAQNNNEQKKQLIYDLIFYAARVLLITRGLEPKNEEDVFKAFEENFIATGLVDASFKLLIACAREKDYTALLEKEANADNLAKSVEKLYENMDNSFNFKLDAQLSIEASLKPPVSNVVKDFRGVGCPMNFVKTKIELAKLETGQILEVWLDEGEAIENVPGSVISEGHKVISKNKIQNYWVVVIEKG